MHLGTDRWAGSGMGRVEGGQKWGRPPSPFSCKELDRHGGGGPSQATTCHPMPPPASSFFALWADIAGTEGGRKGLVPRSGRHCVPEKGEYGQAHIFRRRRGGEEHHLPHGMTYCRKQHPFSALYSFPHPHLPLQEGGETACLQQKAPTLSQRRHAMQILRKHLMA